MSVLSLLAFHLTKRMRLKVIKKAESIIDRQRRLDEYIRRHERSIIELLRNEPERARAFVARVSKSLELAA